MAKIRRHKIKGFTIVSNKMLQDMNLSLKAKGLMAQMYSYPDDWDFSIVGLSKLCKEGKDSIMGALRELESAQYLVRTPVKDGKGQFKDIQYDLYPEPMTVIPYPVFPHADNATQSNNNITNKNRNKKENTLFTESTKESRFQKPTFEEVEQYWKEKKLKGSPREFWLYYDSNGWKVGKNPMKNWHSAASGWSLRENDKFTQKNYGKVTNPYYNPDEQSDLQF